MTLVSDRINLAVSPEAKGGGGGFDEGFGDIRGEFKDTALWLPDFVTDANGEGTVEADCPTADTGQHDRSRRDRGGYAGG
ncbi:MAG: hypothetical protein U0401_30090 [Anaerolineae bacterium]